MISNSISHEEYLRRKRKKRLLKFLYFFLSVVFIIGALSYLSYRKEFRISEIKLEGGVLVTEPEIKEKTLEFLKGSYFWVFPKNNFLIYSDEKLKIFLKDSFQRIDEVNINLVGFKTLEIKISERKPYAIWCREKIDSLEGEEQVPEDCYFMDQNSTIFAKAPNFSGNAYFKYYGVIDLNKEDSPIGKEYMSDQIRFKEIGDFISNLKSIYLNPVYLIKKEDYFSIGFSDGVNFYFDLRGSLVKSFDNLKVLLETPTFSNYKEDLGVQYIDLRYGNKLFYKLKQ